MKSTVQARLDGDAKKTLDQLTQQLGWSTSQIVGEGIRLVAASRPAPGRSRVAGVGQFSSKLPDLGSNKKHLKGFGR